MWYSTTKLARREKVTPQTVRRWIGEGHYDRVEYTLGGHARVWVEAASKASTILYARASSAKQRSSVETQERILHKAYPNGEMLSDIGSGFNFKRRGFRVILERALQGEQIHVVATTSDRITRSGFPLVRHIIELPGGSIELLEEDGAPGQFDVRTLIAFITSYCNSLHGRRGRKRHPAVPSATLRRNPPNP